MTDPRPTTILVVDDHPLLLSGLGMLLNAEADLEVVGQTDRAPSALELAKKLQPDIILLDITLNDTSGIDLLPQLLEVSPDSRVIMLTMHENQRYLQLAMNAGARGFVLKKGLDADLLYAIRTVQRGEVYVHPSMLLEFVGGDGGRTDPQEDQETPDHRAQLWHSLSQREQQVMLAVAQGHTSREIAARYFVSDKTVTTYRSRAMTKLGLGNKAELVKLIMDLGLLKS
ncbi:response regulator [Desulfurivibrio dismutans]|uniref:response regulator n=1 Tax=Desulfurivibrio dismutans TaxID=1398908 RepID=UPI0023DAEA54|nr:response regulator transcription factor [Desulfurivibrio alkaliphilus]MDF1614438.1 response regulator transcription factor [Desulfurivibrio alkaliphilus]